MTSHLTFDPSAIRAVAIDLDGTLVDTLKDFHAALTSMLKDLSLPPVSRDAVAGFIGKGTEHLLRSVLAHVSPQTAAESRDALYAAAFKSYMPHYEAINGEYAEVYSGVREGLAALHAQGLKLACLTNKPESFARTLLARKGLDGFFAHTAGGDTYAQKKPHPLPLLETAKTLGVEQVAMLMVGDSVNDALAARAAGSPVVLVPYGYSHGMNIKTIDSNGIVESLLTLAQALAQTQGQTPAQDSEPSFDSI